MLLRQIIDGFDVATTSMDNSFTTDCDPTYELKTKAHLPSANRGVRFCGIKVIGQKCLRSGLKFLPSDLAHTSDQGDGKPPNQAATIEWPVQSGRVVNKMRTILSRAYLSVHSEGNAS